jgi:hypothetical protein
MKGLHASKIRSGWIEWAKKEIKNFEEQLRLALEAKEQPRPAGRTYILRKWKSQTLDR